MEATARAQLRGIWACSDGHVCECPTKKSGGGPFRTGPTPLWQWNKIWNPGPSG